MGARTDLKVYQEDGNKTDSQANIHRVIVVMRDHLLTHYDKNKKSTLLKCRDFLQALEVLL